MPSEQERSAVGADRDAGVGRERRHEAAPFVLPPDQRPWTISARHGVLLVVLVVATGAALLTAYQTIA
jgi:hypothetical protein